MNWHRVLLGGLLAGVVINVLEFILNGVFLAKDWEAAFLALGMRPIAGGPTAVFFVWRFVLWGFLIGILAVWLYAAIRPRFGAGPRTAFYVGSVAWGLGYLMTAVSPILLKLYPLRISLSVGLVEVLLGTQIGARLYRERDAA